MQNIYWDLLKKNREKSKDRRIETLFQSDKNRFKEFAIEIEDLYFDYSKTNIDLETLKNLIAYAKNLKIMNKPIKFFDPSLIKYCSISFSSFMYCIEVPFFDLKSGG